MICCDTRRVDDMKCKCENKVIILRQFVDINVEVSVIREGVVRKN